MKTVAVRNNDDEEEEYSREFEMASKNAKGVSKEAKMDEERYNTTTIIIISHHRE